MKKSLNQFGFSVAEGFLLLVLAAIVGLVGYKVYSAHNTLDSQYQRASASTQAGQSEIAAVPVIKTTSDLDKAEQALNQQSPDDSNSDLSQMDDQVNGL